MEENHGLAKVSLCLGAAIYVVIFFVLLWDVWVTTLGRENETVSAIVSGWSRRYPVVTLAVGVVLGHIFWR